ncbi:MAG: hypothetical protein WCT37_00900 [Patescibacteria group bacterium]|jgi:hypothetical protein
MNSRGIGNAVRLEAEDFPIGQGKVEEILATAKAVAAIFPGENGRPQLVIEFPDGRQSAFSADPKMLIREINISHVANHMMADLP